MKLLTWNIQWGRGVDGRVDLGRIAAHVHAQGDVDVICLQEVSAAYTELAGNDGGDQFEALAALFPQHEAISGFAMDAAGDDSVGRRNRRKRFGNMILSRYPARRVYRHLLPWPSDSQVRSMQRIAVEANLDTPAGLLRVTTTHLEYYSARQRRAQVERLRELHREAVEHARRPGIGGAGDGPFAGAERGAMAILTGDCNFLPESVDHALLLSPIDAATPAYRDAWQLCHPGVPHAPTVGLYDKEQWPGEPFTFDFIYVSEDLAPRVRRLGVDAECRASDHQPVMLELD